MSTEKNKATELRQIDAMNKRDLTVLDHLADEIFTADSILHDPGLTEEVRGPEGMKKVSREILNNNPGMQLIVEDMIAEGDKVVCRVTAKTTDVKTGKPVNILLLWIDRFVGDKIAEGWELVVPGQW